MRGLLSLEGGWVHVGGFAVAWECRVLGVRDRGN